MENKCDNCNVKEFCRIGIFHTSRFETITCEAIQAAIKEQLRKDISEMVLKHILK